MQTVVCLERTGLPDHLKQLPNIETPLYLQGLLMDLEDSGEVPCYGGVIFFESKLYNKQIKPRKRKL